MATANSHAGICRIDLGRSIGVKSTLCNQRGRDISQRQLHRRIRLAEVGERPHRAVVRCGLQPTASDRTQFWITRSANSQKMARIRSTGLKPPDETVINSGDAAADLLLDINNVHIGGVRCTIDTELDTKHRVERIGAKRVPPRPELIDRGLFCGALFRGEWSRILVSHTESHTFVCSFKTEPYVVRPSICAKPDSPLGSMP